MRLYKNIGHSINNYHFSIARYAGEYVPDGRQFIVVAGNINYETVQVTLSYESHLKNLSKLIEKKITTKIKIQCFH